MTNTFAAADFIKKLTDGSLRTPLICEGFAKAIEGNREAFLFSPGMSCEIWTKVPTEIVEKVELLGEVPCRDHSHPFVQVHFKEPPPSDPYSAVFSSLLRASSPGQAVSSGTGAGLPRSTMMQSQRDQFIGEWLGRVIADSSWFGKPSGSSTTGTNVGINKLCWDATRKCKRIYPYQYISDREQQRGCEQMEYWC